MRNDKYTCTYLCKMIHVHSRMEVVYLYRGDTVTVRTKAANEAQYRYNQAHIKRVPLDMQLTDYEAVKVAATAAGQAVNTYIKQAITERMERDNNAGD